MTGPFLDGGLNRPPPPAREPRPGEEYDCAPPKCCPPNEMPKLWPSPPDPSEYPIEPPPKLWIEGMEGEWAEEYPPVYPELMRGEL